MFLKAISYSDQKHNMDQQAFEAKLNADSYFNT